MSRHVRTLHLTAPTAPLARRGAFLVEDALRTASFAGGQRVVLIRRLDVGKIDPRRPPATVALALERAWQSIVGQWVYADSPAAENSSIVWFQDAVEPYILFAQQMARGEIPTAWFWRKAIPAEIVDDPTPLRRLLFTLIERHGLLATAAFIGELHQRKVLLPLLEQLRPADGDLLWSFYTPSSLPPTPLPFPVSHFAFPISAVPSWNQSDPRALWLVATLLIYEKPARLAAPYLRPMAEVLVKSTRVLTPSASPTGDHKGTPLQEEDLRPASRVLRSREDNPPNTPHPASHALPDLHPTESDPDGVYSEYAGLFLLINVLEMLGMGKWCDAMPELIEGDFPTRLLRHLVRLMQPHRTFHPPNDRGVSHAATVSPPPSGVERQMDDWFGAEEPVTTGGEAGHGKRDMGNENFLLSLFTIRVRCWLARHLHYDLATLIRRPGRVVWTRTHVDVIFDERQVDLPVRLAGVDIDPGWVPWWGRVVKFHYEAMEKS